MTHPSELQLSMHADDALSGDDAAVVAKHLESCAVCQSRYAVFRAEAQFIASAMMAEAGDESLAPTAPKFARSTSLRSFALANLATGLVIWLGQFLWKTLFGELIVNATTRVTSVYLPDVYELTSAAALHYLEEGTAMLDAYLGFVVASVITFSILWLLLVYRRSRATLGVLLLATTTGAVLAPTPVDALEVRRDDDIVTIAGSETIDDTVLVGAETVVVEGVVKGDLVAVGRRIDVNGSVEGNLVTFAESVTVRGSVAGLVLGASSSYDLFGATVGGDAWLASEIVRVDDNTRIGRNATIAASTATVDGGVGKDFHAFAETVELSGVLGEDLEAFAERVRLLGDAHIGGDVRFRSGNEDRLHRADTVRVDGVVEFPDMPEELEERSRYVTLDFYLWQIARLVSAFVVGLALLVLVPGLRTVALGSGVETLKTAGIGFLTVVSIPVAAVLVGFTLIGLPVSFFAFAAWLLGIYLAKILVAAILGSMILGDSDSLPKTLLAGLAAVLVAVNLPFIGGIINVLLTIVGLGLLVQYVIDSLAARRAGEFD